MTGEKKIHIGSGNYNETNVSDNAKYAGRDFYENASLAEKSTEIIKVLEDSLDFFEQNPNISIPEAQQKVKTIQKSNPEILNAEIVEATIKSHYPLQQRLRAAGEAAYLETVKLVLPPVGIAIEAIKAWNNPD